MGVNDKLQYKKTTGKKRRGVVYALISVFLLLCFLGILFGENISKAVYKRGKDLKVFILLGQSNMGGYAKRSEFPEKLQKANEDVVIMTDGIWVPLEPREEFNGPEISFAHEMKKVFPKSRIGIIKIAIGGAGIRAFVPDWSAELAAVSEDEGLGSLYGKLLKHLEISNRDESVEYMGILWEQGAKDMDEKEHAEGYLDYLTGIITQLRTDTGTPELPLFVGAYFNIETLDKLKSLDYPGVKYREAIYEVMRDHNLAAERIPYTRTVLHGQLPVLEDGVHFTTQGQITLGELFAQAVRAYYDEVNQ